MIDAQCVCEQCAHGVDSKQALGEALVSVFNNTGLWQVGSGLILISCLYIYVFCNFSQRELINFEIREKP